MDTPSWYATIAKPSWAPPSRLFGPVWTVLYVIIAITYGRVVQLVVRHEVPAAVLLPFALNLVFNLAFSPIQFGLRSFRLAAVDIALTLLTLIWAMVAIYSYQRWVVYANVPYLLWVCFATVLQFTITAMNPAR